MRFADHPLREWNVGEHLLGHTHRRAVVENLVDVGAPFVAQAGGIALRFKLQHFAHGGLGAFDARREHRFLRGQR